MQITSFVTKLLHTLRTCLPAGFQGSPDKPPALTNMRFYDRIHKTIDSGGVIVLIENNDLCMMRQFIERCVGERVQLFANKGRRKAVVKEGVIENSYPSIFTIRIENEFDSTRRLSYSYTDLLTKVVELVVCKDGQHAVQIASNASPT